MSVGCASQKVNGVETPLTAADVARLGCRPGDPIDKSFVADAGRPGHVRRRQQSYHARAPKTFRNNNTAWWDASQIYGYDALSRERVKRDPDDPARLLMVQAARREQTPATARAICRCCRTRIRRTPTGRARKPSASRTTGPSG